MDSEVDTVLDVDPVLSEFCERSDLEDLTVDYFDKKLIEGGAPVYFEGGFAPPSLLGGGRESIWTIGIRSRFKLKKSRRITAYGMSSVFFDFLFKQVSDQINGKYGVMVPKEIVKYILGHFNCHSTTLSLRDDYIRFFDVTGGQLKKTLTHFGKRKRKLFEDTKRKYTLGVTRINLFDYVEESQRIYICSTQSMLSKSFICSGVLDSDDTEVKSRGEDVKLVSKFNLGKIISADGRADYDHISNVFKESRGQLDQLLSRYKNNDEVIFFFGTLKIVLNGNYLIAQNDFEDTVASSVKSKDMFYNLKNVVDDDHASLGVRYTYIKGYLKFDSDTSKWVVNLPIYAEGFDLDFLEASYMISFVPAVLSRTFVKKQDVDVEMFVSLG